MDMHHVKYFLAVCETLNFTRAAEKCHVSQPALSRAIQQLEDEVGGLLFRRERNLTHITDLGALIRPRLERIRDQADEARSAAQRFLTLTEAQVTVGIMCTIGPARFTGFLAHFNGSNPGVRIRLVEASPQELIDKLSEGELDVAVLACPEGLPDRLVTHTLYREEFHVAFAHGHRFAELDAVPFCDTSGETYLRRLNCEYYDCLSQVCESRGADLPEAHASEREDWILNMVAAGMGICFLPAYAAVIPGVLTRLLVDPCVARDVTLACMAGRRFSPAVLAFIKALKAYRWPGDSFEPTTAAA
jgi:LysR family hydrogen peroxide-inducible transcriptional activator